MAELDVVEIHLPRAGRSGILGVAEADVHCLDPIETDAAELGEGDLPLLPSARIKLGSFGFVLTKCPI